MEEEKNKWGREGILGGGGWQEKRWEEEGMEEGKKRDKMKNAKK